MVRKVGGAQFGQDKKDVARVVTCVVALYSFIISVSVVFIPPNTTTVVQSFDPISTNVKAS